MGIIIPRPQMRSRERRNIEERLARHAEFMREFEAKGYSRNEASAAAMRCLEREDDEARDAGAR